VFLEQKNNISVQSELENSIQTHKKMYLKILMILGGLFATLLSAMILGTSIGPVTIPFQHTVAIVLDYFKFNTGVEFVQRDYIVITEIRLPRVIVGALVGVALGISGAVMQVWDGHK
jgi:iron complex transport system permease protein